VIVPKAQAKAVRLATSKAYTGNRHTSLGKETRRKLARMAAHIEAHGWDSCGRSIGAAAIETPGAGECAMDAIRAQTGCTVVTWESLPGRTQADVLALLLKVAG